MVALMDSARTKPSTFAVSALGAGKTSRPSELEKFLVALFFCPVQIMEFFQTQAFLKLYLVLVHVKKPLFLSSFFTFYSPPVTYLSFGGNQEEFYQDQGK